MEFKNDLKGTRKSPCRRFSHLIDRETRDRRRLERWASAFDDWNRRKEKKSAERERVMREEGKKIPRKGEKIEKKVVAVGEERLRGDPRRELGA